MSASRYACPDESAALLAYSAAEKFDLVIFDTARRVFAVKYENDNAEVYNRIVPTLDALKALGIATLTMATRRKTAASAHAEPGRRKVPAT